LDHAIQEFFKQPRFQAIMKASCKRLLVRPRCWASRSGFFTESGKVLLWHLFMSKFHHVSWRFLACFLSII